MKLSSSEVRRARPLLGTFVEITVSGFSESEARDAVEAAFATIADVQRRMSFHDPASQLSEINQNAFRKPVAVDRWTFAVLKLAQTMWRVSEGVFDVSVAPRLQELGFLPPSQRAREADGSSLPGFEHVSLLAGRRVRFHHPGVRLDLGGIAKGFAVDRAIGMLRTRGVPRALVNAGGDLRALGREPFSISLRSPLDPAQTLPSFPLADAALASSAHSFADRVVPGAAHGPIVDPSSGTPARTVLGATVRARSAMVADALTKVVMLRGEAALPTLNHFSATAFFVARGGEFLCSPHWNAAVHFSA